MVFLLTEMSQSPLVVVVDVLLHVVDVVHDVLSQSQWVLQMM